MIRTQVSLLGCAALLLCPTFAFSQVLQSRGGVRSASFIEAPRHIEQELRDAQRSIDGEEFSDAVVRLGNLLQRDMNEARNVDLAGQDFFLIDGSNKNSALLDESFLRRARQMLGELPTAALDTYELQFGALAQRMLQEASENRDWEKLRSVRRKFFHTKAGYEASLLLAQRELLEGHPLSASLLLDAVVSTPRAINHLGQSVTLMHLACAHLAGREIDSFEVSGRGELVLGTKKAKWPTKDDVMVWIEDHFDIAQSRSAFVSKDHTYLGGQPDRNGGGAGQMPLSSERWTIETTASTRETRILSDIESDLSATGKLPAPSLTPIRVGDQLIMRTTDTLYGVDYESGVRVWSYPWQPTNGEQKADNIASINAITGEDEGPKKLLMQRVWNDLPYGQMTSDGERVYVIYDLAEVEIINLNPNLFGRGTRPANVRGNTLAAFELATEGKMRWQQGKSSDQASMLAEAFFLGPPLPLDGRLYAMIEMAGDISVVCLDPKSGEEIWRQQLVAVETGGIEYDAVRRIAGASPTYHEGVLVCPTGAGATVAIDLADRMLRWGIKYARRTDTSQYRSTRTQQDPKSLLERWHAGLAVADEQSVFLTPIESDRLFCVDLLTGSSKFSSKSRSQMRYLAGVRDGKFLLVGNRDARAYDAETGAEVWRTSSKLLSAGQHIIGRGVYGSGSYFLPASGNVLIQISLKDGSELGRRETQFSLGNLVAVDGEIVSQSPTEISVAYGEASLEPRVDAALEKNPDDVENLVRKAELLIQRKSRDEAMKLLARAKELSPDNENARRLLIEAMLGVLREDPEDRDDLVQKLISMIDSQEKMAEFLGLRIRGALAGDKIDDAIEHVLELSELAAVEKGLDDSADRIEGDSSRWFTLDAWISARVQEILQGADDSQKQTLKERYEEFQADKAQDANSLLIRIVKHFEPIVSEVLLPELSLQLPKEGRSSTLEQLALGATAPHELADLAKERLLPIIEAQISMRRGTDALEAIGSLVAKTAGSDDGEDRPSPDMLKKIKDLRTRALQTIPADVDWGTEVSAEIQTQDLRLDMGASSTPKIGRTQVASGKTFRGWKLTSDQSGSALGVLDGLGGPHAIPMDEGVQNSDSDHEAIISGSTMLIVRAGEISAIDLSKIQNNRTHESRVWKRDFSGDGASIAKRRSQSNSFGAPVFWYPINAPTARVTAAEFRVGPILGDRVMVLLGGELMAMDLTKGETIWRNMATMQSGNIVAHQKQIALVSPKAQSVQIFNVLDGKEVESRPWKYGAVWHTSGRYVLAEEEGPRKRTSTLRLVDPFEDNVVLEYKTSNANRLIEGVRTFGRIVSGQYLVLLNTDGLLKIWDIQDGSQMCELETPAMELDRLHAIEMDGQLVVLPGKKIDASSIDKKRTLQTRRSSNHQTSSAAYAVSLETGKLNWKVMFDQPWGCTLTQPASSPMLLFSRMWTSYERTGPRVQKLDVRALDIRNGDVLLDKMQLPLTSQNSDFSTSITCQPIRRRIVTRVSNLILTYAFAVPDAIPSN